MWVKHFVLSIITFTGGATTINVTDTCGQQGGVFNYPAALNISGNW